MRKLNNSDFESIENIIKGLNIKYEEYRINEAEVIQSCWNETIGNKISKFTKVYKINTDKVITVICSDSYVSNELYYQKDKIIQLMNKKLQKVGIQISDVKIDYRKWEEQTK